MLKLFTLLISITVFASLASCQSSDSMSFRGQADTIRLPLGKRFVLLEKTQYGNNNQVVYVNLHDDERIAVHAARRVLKTHGGLLLRFLNDSTRLIYFKVSNEVWCFDPNRMFTKILDSCINQGYNKKNNQRNKALVIDHIKRFAALFLKEIPVESKLLVALHNNKPTERIDILRYVGRNGHPTNGAKAVYVNDVLDKDDFMLTTDSVLYRKLAGLNFNIILEDHSITVDDGSLSIYYGQAGKPYINVEAEHGTRKPHLTQQVEMLAHVIASMEDQ